MYYIKMFVLSILLFGMCDYINSMEIATTEIHDSSSQGPLERPLTQEDAELPLLNQQATLLYEQAFFCELLLAIFCRRIDQFHVDVLKAHDKVIEKAVQAFDKPNKLKFDFDQDSCLHERVTITKLYYAFKYLVRQETYEHLRGRLASCTKEFPFLCRLMPLLKQFEAAKQQCRGLECINNHNTKIQQLIEEYKYDCGAIRGKYQSIVDELRTRIMVEPNTIHYIFHKYLNRPRKILPAFLHSDECTFPNPYEPQYNPLFSSSYPAFSQQFINLPWDLEEEDYSAKSLFIADLVYSYDFQEYWLSRIAAAHYNPEELIIVAGDFVHLHSDSYEKIKRTLMQIENVPGLNPNIEQCLSVLPALSNNLIQLSHKKTHKDAALYISALAKTIENSTLNRSICCRSSLL